MAPICKLSEIIPNDRNPRTINKENYKKIKTKVDEFDVMLELDPIIVDEGMKILGGNMRYKALQDLGVKEVTFNMLTEEMIQRAIAKYKTKGKEKTRQEIMDEVVLLDNASYGKWDLDMLANEWDINLVFETAIELAFMNDAKYLDLIKTKENNLINPKMKLTKEEININKQI